MAAEEKVILGNVNRGEVTHEFFASVISLLLYDINNKRRLACVNPRAGGACVSLARNETVAWFLNDTVAKYLWFVDSDMQFPPETLETLIESLEANNLPLLGGLYMTTIDKLVPALWHYGLDENGKEHMVPFDDIPDERLVEVDATGAGCLLLTRELLLEMWDKYPDARPQCWFEEKSYDGKAWGEDFTFCRRVGRELGHKIFVDTSVDINHIKRTKLHKDMMKEMVAA